MRKIWAIYWYQNLKNFEVSWEVSGHGPWTVYAQPNCILLQRIWIKDRCALCERVHSLQTLLQSPIPKGVYPIFNWRVLSLSYKIVKINCTRISFARNRKKQSLYYLLFYVNFQEGFSPINYTDFEHATSHMTLNILKYESGIKISMMEKYGGSDCINRNKNL